MQHDRLQCILVYQGREVWPDAPKHWTDGQLDRLDDHKFPADAPNLSHPNSC